MEVYIIIGASSELAISFKKLCVKRNIKTVGFSRNSMNKNLKDTFFLDDYLEDYEKIYKILKNYKNYTVIFFNGALYENRPIQYPSEKEIALTEKINCTIPSELYLRINKDFVDVKKYVFISSMAAVKLRNKNFVYGYYKKKLESNILSEKLDNSLIFRFGKIFTNMSKNHSTPPFSLKPERAAEIILNKIHKKGVVYPNFGLFLIALVLHITPSAALKKLRI